MLQYRESLKQKVALALDMLRLPDKVDAFGESILDRAISKAAKDPNVWGKRRFGKKKLITNEHLAFYLAYQCKANWETVSEHLKRVHLINVKPHIASIYAARVANRIIENHNIVREALEQEFGGKAENIRV